MLGALPEPQIESGRWSQPDLSLNPRSASFQLKDPYGAAKKEFFPPFLKIVVKMNIT